ncbi:uncharacterized protein LOC144566610 [Carex rostrata]
MQHVAENLSKATGGDTWVTDTFRWNCRKKKPRRVVEMTSSFARYMPKANLYLMKVGKNNPRDVNEDPAYEKIYQSRDGGWRWGIMTTNGSESLNAVFKQSRMLPVAAVVEDTFYKLNAWFQERRAKAAELIRMNQSFSTRVEEKLRRHRDKGATMTVIPMGNDGTEFEVQNPNEYVPTTRKPDGTMAFVKRACKYVVKFGDARAVTCTCQGPQLSHIPCSHVMAVCRVRNYCEDHYVADMYRTDYLASTWGGSFHSYPDQHEWPTYVGDRILPSEGWIRKGRRRHKRIVMTMDEMGGRRPSGNRARRSVSDRCRADLHLSPYFGPDLLFCQQGSNQPFLKALLVPVVHVPLVAAEFKFGMIPGTGTRCFGHNTDSGFRFITDFKGSMPLYQRKRSKLKLQVTGNIILT